MADEPAPGYDYQQRRYLRGLGVVYVVAFVSLAVQIRGLIGDEGILPASRFLDVMLATGGPSAHWEVPTLAWWVGARSGPLVAMAWCGALCGAALILGIVPKLFAIMAWVLYLSLVSVGQVFLGFQWDTLLLEAGLLAALFAPWGIRPRPGPPGRPAALLWLCWLLVAKLHVTSGLAKLLSGDLTWRALTALDYHYWTTCLPTWIGWWASQLPTRLHRVATLLVLLVEIVAPLAIFAGRRPRHAAAILLIVLQLGIAATGNYGFFNLLTVVLCLALFDGPRHGRPRASTLLVMVPIAVLMLTPMIGRLLGPRSIPAPVERAWRALAPTRSFNAYGLFATMTTRRPEIIVEASMDGQTWEPYVFRWKPGDVTARPAFVAPHMPRLDWQMWFAALQGPRQARWMAPFLDRLLTASPDVLALVARAPHGVRRPLAVRARLFDYEFTTRAERDKTGAWWTRRLIGPYAGPVRSAG